jgi:electron transfer flavoprotein beta subunit
VIAACLKWVDRRPEIDPMSAQVHTDARTAGASPADEAALEWALRAGEATGAPVLAVSAGPPAAESVLRKALEAGADRAALVPLAGPEPSEAVARALAAVLRDAGATMVWCGDHSLDRGSGSVPAYLAAELGLAQALGLVEVGLVEVTLTAGVDVAGLRRLDRGRRERVALSGGGVVSVEGATARLRRATLDAARWARTATVERCGAEPTDAPTVERVLRPFRPRARVLPAPQGREALDRIAALTDAGTAKAHNEVVTLSPADAAARLLEAMAAWGYDLPG